MTSNEPKSGNIVLVVAFIFAALVVLLMLFNYAAFGQTNMGPIKTNQINQDLFVGQSGYATIQSAVNFGCKTGNKNFRVVIPAGATPSDTPTAITGGCTATYIDDKRTNNEALYSWNGTAYVINPPPTGGGDGGGAAPAQVPYAFNFTDETLQKLAATANATYDPATNTITFNTTFVQTNGYFGFSIFHPQPNVPSGYGDDGQGIGNISTGNSGPGKTVGNPNGIINYDGGWRSIHGPQWLIQKIASGIGNGFELTLDASAAIGDSKAFSIGHSSAGGCQAASDECFAMATFGGGQGPEYTGTVVSTKGQGDITPLFSGPVINGGFIEDLSKVVLTGNLAAASLPWTQSPPTVHVGSLPVTATVTPSTWVANLTSVIAASQILSVPQPQAFTATTVQGAEGAPGTVWVASSNYSEQCSVNGSTISCAYGHAIGDQIFKGGTKGCLSMDLEAAQAPNFTNHTDVIVYGGIDTSHLAIGFTTSQGLQTFPIAGTMFSGTTSPFHVVQCARVVSLLADKLTEILEPNDVTWAANDTIVAPNPTSAHTYGFVVGMNELSPNNPSITDQEFSQHCTGMGCSGAHFPLYIYNHNPMSKYAQGMTYNPNNNLQAWVAGRIIGPYSDLFDMDFDPIYSNVPTSSLFCVATIFCRRNLSGNTLPVWMWKNGADDMDYLQITTTPTKQATFGYQVQAHSFVNLPQIGPFDAFTARSIFNSGTAAGYAYANQYDGSGIGNTEVAARTAAGLSYGGHWWKLDVAGMLDVIDVANGRVMINAGLANAYIPANQPLLCSDMYGYVSAAPTGSTCTVGERGTVTLSAGSVTVPSTTITLAGVVFLQNCNVSGTPGILTVGARLAGTSFVINSTNSSDNSQVCWFVPTAVTATRQRRPPIRAAAPPSSQHPAPPRRPGRPS